MSSLDAFWERANLVCSQRELEILTQRAAGMRWDQVAQLQHISIRQSHRVWSQAIERTAGRIDAHPSRRSNP